MSRGQKLRLSFPPSLKDTGEGGLPGYPKIFAPLRMLQSGHRAMPSNHQQAGHLGKEIGLGPSSIPESGLNRKKYLFPTQQL